MKKYLILIVLFVFCSTLCFSACSDEKKDFWTQTSKDITSYITTIDKNDLFNFGENVNEIIKNDVNGLYKELDEKYKEVYFASSFCIEQYSSVFTIEPYKKPKNLSKLFKDVNKKFLEFKSQIQIYQNKKTDYSNQVNYTSLTKAYEDIEVFRLTTIKNDIINLINSALNLSNSILKVYKAGYYDFVNFEEISDEAFTDQIKEANVKLALNTVNLELSTSVSKFLKIFNDNGIPTDYDKYWQSSIDFYNDVKDYYNKETLSFKATLKQDFIIWKGIYESFNEDSKLFSNIIEGINFKLLKICNNDAVKYAEETNNPKDQQKVTYYLNFYDKINLFTEYSNLLYE